MSWHSQLTRGTRIVAVGGLAIGVGLGAMAAVGAATSSPTPTVASPSPGGAGTAPQRHRGPGRRHALGVGGTITEIRGSSLTLRTEPGTETVNTSASTQYRRERQTIQLSDLRVGDVVHVRAVTGSTPPAQPGTGTITAAAIAVVEPSLAGRVTGIDGDTLNLVGRDGRLLTVTLTGATRYYNGAATADRSAVTTGSRIRAAGNRDSLTHLTADIVAVLPARPAGAGGAPSPRGGPGAAPADMPGFDRPASGVGA